MFYTTGARLAAALLGYVVLVIVLLTLNPFYLVLPEHLWLSLHGKPRDIVANVLLFLPIGFLYRLTGGGRRGALLIGAAISAGVEAGQLFVPVRTPSAVDLVTNTLGAAIGARIHDLLATRIAVTPAMVGRLALEAPLMGLIYLLVPLLWVNALTLVDAPSRWALTALIGICGAIVLSDIYRQWRGPVGIRSTGRVALAAGMWFLVGSAPGLLQRPLPALAIGAGITALTASLAAAPSLSADRRFERATLSRVCPVFALYLILAALWPPFRPLGSWHGTFGLTDRLEQENLKALLPLIEYLAAFTVLGYLTAEWRGRSELRLAQDLPRLLLVTTVSALILEGIVGFQVGPSASLIRTVMVINGALFGGLIYHLQRDHVQFLLGRSRAQGASGRLERTSPANSSVPSVSRGISADQSDSHLL
jgi:glycopeptide antibiotics resistance protein